ncbi:hypothetical protein EV182_000661 [Spiromyces aspiralis]|uniref:Uncharacterized protein n=1 Tax=Spiromyces aspiralis TaxID=68401 RepID=A0ACC1HXR0_9FUNG|nr:hypothetical protein EV182_000661 [Spiromyces aspiralis]
MRSISERQRSFEQQPWPYRDSESFLAQPFTLASAGFYFEPSAEAPDSVACFLCGHSLGGWEPSDDPFVEHAQHRPDCPWVLTHCKKRRSQLGDRVVELRWDPAEERDELVKFMDNNDARLSTFGDAWPHDSKKGWGATSKKLAKAGFYYTPEHPGDDTATCIICGYQLAQWEPDDDPKAEHRRRTPDCQFFKKAAMKAAITRSKTRKGAKRNADRGRSESVSHETPPVAQSSDAEGYGSDSTCIKEHKKLRHTPEYSGPPALKTIPEVNSPAQDTAASSEEGERDNAKGVEDNEPKAVERHSTPMDDVHPPGDFEDYSGSGGSFPNMNGKQEAVVHQTGGQAPSTEERDPDAMRVEEETKGAAASHAGTESGSDHRGEHLTAEEELKSKWDLTEQELDMTVEEFIRHSAHIRLEKLQAASTSMIEHFLQRAEATRKMVASIR